MLDFSRSYDVTARKASWTNLGNRGWSSRSIQGKITRTMSKSVSASTLTSLKYLTQHFSRGINNGCRCRSVIWTLGINRRERLANPFKQQSSKRRRSTKEDRSLMSYPTIDHAKLFRSILDSIIINFTIIFEKILLRERSFLIADATIGADGHWSFCGRTWKYSQIYAGSKSCANTTKIL